MTGSLTSALYEASTDCFGKSRKRRVFAGVGAVNQRQGAVAVSTCNRCRGEVVWLKSERTGRSYLVNVFRGQRGQRYYVGSSFHRARCDQRTAEQAKASDDFDAGRRVGQKWNAAMAAVRSGDLTLMAALEATGDVPDGAAGVYWQDGFRTGQAETKAMVAA